jgi:sigma-B regulation protein RsbU (phosphoserine phosphatase)
LREGEAPRYLLEEIGTALGLEPGLNFTRTELSLKQGDTLIFYTDGVTEAFNPAGECYNSARLLNGLHTLTDADPTTINAAILRAVESFAAGARQSDDIAVLSFKITGLPTSVPPTTPPGQSCEFPATRPSVMSAVKAVREFGRREGLREEEIFALSLAVEECGSNIVQHACASDHTQRFQLSCARAGHVVNILLSDGGAPLDPAVMSAPAPGAANDCGGWGLHLARSFLDGFEYARETGRNTWRLTKHVLVSNEELSKEKTELCP